MATTYSRLKQRRDTAANWQTNNPVLLAGEIGVETDTRRLKIGDGVARWNEIPYSGYTAEEAADMVREIAYTKQQVNDMIDGVAETIPTKTSDLTNDSGFSTFSGSYNDLTDKPSLFSGRYEDLSGKPALFSGSYNDLSDKPSLFSGSYNDLTDKPSLFSGRYEDLSGKPSLSTVATTGSYTDLKDKPALFSGRYDDLTGKPNLSTVATTGNYADLSNKPTIPTVGDGTITIKQGNVTKGTFTTNQSGNTTITIDEGGEFSQQQADWAQTDTTQADFIKNKPELFSGSYNDLTDKPALFSGSYNDLTNKPTIPTKTSDLTNDSGFSTFSGSYNDLTNKPTIPAAQVNSDWNAASGVAQILNKPNIPTKTSELTNDSGFSTFSGDYNDLSNTPEFALVATTGKYEDLEDKPEIPSVGDATITVNVNNTRKTSFTTNQRINGSIDLTIPTKTSDLTNDSGFTTFSGNYNDLRNKPTLFSGDYLDLTNKPTIPTVNDSALTIQKNGTTIATFTANDDTNKTVNITVPTSETDLGLSSETWTFTLSDNTTVSKEVILK